MTYRELWHLLCQVYDEGEAKAVARMVFEVGYGLTWADLLMGREASLPADALDAVARRLLRHEPVQYVLGQADFCGRSFCVEPGVLIPRPETEELCRWMVASADTWQPFRSNGTAQPLRLLDIGTGSGCIAITLAKELPTARVEAWDISSRALDVARRNALRHQADVLFRQTDVLATNPADVLDTFTAIVSNPPYICNKERAAMLPNVLDYEPPEALFVADDDALLFYRAIARLARTALQPSGWLYFEINPHYADTLRQLLIGMHFRNIELRNDAFGKQRMIRAQR